ncbi:hypothetical protein HY639_03920 [Candidatus Woesearchaeota archaeon]|nr:hypothetical protein [Candidatus Woesearchaeota archaeon]
MKKSMVYLLMVLFLLQIVAAYPAIVVLTGSITSPNGRALVGYAPTWKILDSNRAQIYDSGSTYTNVLFNPYSCMFPGITGATGRSDLQSSVIQLNPGQTYSMTVSFQAVCTRSSGVSGQATGATAANGGCWGKCTSDGYKNYKKHKSCGYYYRNCNTADANYACDMDFNTGPCEGERQNAENPVSATVDSPNVATFGDDTPITFVAP